MAKHDLALLALSNKLNATEQAVLTLQSAIVQEEVSRRTKKLVARCKKQCSELGEAAIHVLALLDQVKVQDLFEGVDDEAGADADDAA